MNMEAVCCQAIVHAVISVNNDSSIPSEPKWTLLLGFSNVFNCINHDVIFEEMRAHIPSMAA